MKLVCNESALNKKKNSIDNGISSVSSSINSVSSSTSNLSKAFDGPNQKVFVSKMGDFETVLKNKNKQLQYYSDYISGYLTGLKKVLDKYASKSANLK